MHLLKVLPVLTYPFITNSAVCLSTTPNQIQQCIYLKYILPVLTYAFITTITEVESATMIGESALMNIKVRSIKRCA